MLSARKNVSKFDQTALTAFEKKEELVELSNMNIDLKAFMKILFTAKNQRKRQITYRLI